MVEFEKPPKPGAQQTIGPSDSYRQERAEGTRWRTKQDDGLVSRTKRTCLAWHQELREASRGKNEPDIIFGSSIADHVFVGKHVDFIRRPREIVSGRRSRWDETRRESWGLSPRGAEAPSAARELNCQRRTVDV